MYSRCKEIVQLMANNDQKENNFYYARLLWSVQLKFKKSLHLQPVQMRSTASCSSNSALPGVLLWTVTVLLFVLNTGSNITFAYNVQNCGLTQASRSPSHFHSFSSTEVKHTPTCHTSPSVSSRSSPSSDLAVERLHSQWISITFPSLTADTVGPRWYTRHDKWF